MCISDRALDAWYAKDYHAPGIDYFDDIPDDYDPDEDYEDEEPWEKPSERPDFEW